MIRAWVGPFGSGKSGGMTWKLHQAHLAGRRVLTNYGVSFQDEELTSDLLENMPENLRNVAIGTDEIHTILDSRSGQKSKQKRITYVVLQTRKRSVDWDYTTQALHQVEKRLVQHTDIVIYCENMGCNKMDCREQSCGIPTCGIFHYRVYSGATGEYMGDFWLNGPRDFYPLFDSERVITDFTEDD